MSAFVLDHQEVVQGRGLMQAQMEGSIAVPEESQWFYELVPLFPLTEVDLSISMKSHFIRNRHIHRLIRAVTRSSVTLIAYISSLLLAISVFYVPARIGRLLSVASLLTGLPGALVSIGNLRYEIVAVMLKTYDLWFSCTISTVVAAGLGLLLRDARSLLLATSWLSFITCICVDASIIGLRSIWIANVISVIVYIAMAGAITMGMTDDLNTFDIARINGHSLPAVAVVRDSAITMTIVIARNVFRKYAHARDENKSATKSTLFRCVSFRCRLQMQATTANRIIGDHNSRQTAHKASRIQATVVSSKTKLSFKPDPDLQLIDVRNTLFSMGWLWRVHDEGTWTFQQPMPWIGAIGFVTTNVIYLLNVASPDNLLGHFQLPVAIVAAAASTFFVSLTTAAMQRKVLRAVATSFDFLFIVVEITIVHIALADILGWRPTIVVSLFADLQWCVWILCWDAITPPVRKRLGLSRRLAAYIGPSLVVVLAFVVVVVFFVKPPETVNDRVIFSFQLLAHTVEFRALTWYFSCAATISSWAIRIWWRLWMAGDAELVVLDGTVVYENHVATGAKSAKSTAGPRSQARGNINDTAAPLAVVPVG